jgi:DNA polymerase III epsilon subunit-like protein
MPTDPIWPLPITVVDSETSGWHSDPDTRVVEIGAVIMDERGQLVAQFGSLLKPDVLLPKADGALQVNGITREQLDVAPPPDQVLQAFRWWWHAHGCPYLAAYNNDFDRTSFDAIGAVTDRWAPCVMREAARAIKAIDPTYSISRDGRPKFPTLLESVEFYGLPKRRAHSAVNDAIMAAGVLWSIQTWKGRADSGKSEKCEEK